MIESEVERGFSGSVLLVRDGEIVLHEGYGLADRDTGIENTPETIYAIGSTPIDFTHVALLQLVDDGVLNLNDPLSKFFHNLPADRAGMTLDDIRNGASGLPDYPFLPRVDEDPDHTYIDRDELIERFRNAELLFQPGRGREHSHFAWGVLAAVIDKASDMTYPEHVRERILKPAGMTRSGFYGEEFPGEVVAHGYGPRSWGKVNTPPQWGRTSWLVMGSGGMVASVGDLRRFHEAIDSGKLLPPAVLPLYPSDGVYSNGDMYGFETCYNYGGDNLFYISCNASDFRDGYRMDRLARALEELCADRPEPRFSIGIAIGVEEDDSLIVARVLPGTAAEAAGLRAGDVLIRCNGMRFERDAPLEALRPGMELGSPLLIEVERDGTPLMLRLQPMPIER